MTGFCSCKTGIHYILVNKHRRQWVVDRIRLLSSLFAIDICAFAVLENHIHITLKLCPDQFDNLTDDQIMDRWFALFKGPLLVQRYRDGETLSAPELATVLDIVKVWREKLKFKTIRCNFQNRYAKP